MATMLRNLVRFALNALAFMLIACPASAEAPPSTIAFGGAPVFGLSSVGFPAPPKSGLVYICDRNANAVNIYQAGVLTGAKKVAALTKGVDSPIDVYVDRLETVYVLNAGNRSVSVYPRGRTSPSEIISDQIDQPEYVHAGSDGTIYVLATDPNNTIVNWILEYYRGAHSPSLTIEPAQQTGVDPIVLAGITLDPFNNLFTDFTDLCGGACGSTFVLIYPARSNMPLNFGYGGGLKYPGDVQYIANKSLLLVGDTAENKIHGYYDYTIATAPHKPLTPFRAPASYFAYDEADDVLYVSDASKAQVTIYNIYTGKAIGSVGAVSGGVAVDPPADY